MTFNSLTWPMLMMADRFAIGATLSAAAVAIYTIPFQLAQRSGIVPNALTNALFPRMSSLSPEGRRLILDKAVRLLAAAITVPVFVGLFLFKPFLYLWVGPEMGEASYRIGMIIIFGYWASSFLAVYFTYYQSEGRPAMVARIIAVQVPPYLILLWLVLPRWGLEGAAWLFFARTYLTFIPLLMTNKPSARIKPTTPRSPPPNACRSSPTGW